METSNRQERRRSQRINLLHLSLPIEIKLGTEKDFIPGIVTDISTNGIGILSFKQLKLNSVVYLKLHLKKIKTGNITSKVVWLKEKDKTYRVGLQFITISPKDFFNIYNFIKTSNTNTEKNFV
jgi:c-di-GMP-binding flagellar brake protein YcgR